MIIIVFSGPFKLCHPSEFFSGSVRMRDEYVKPKKKGKREREIAIKSCIKKSYFCNPKRRDQRPSSATYLKFIVFCAKTRCNPILANRYAESDFPF